MMRGSSACVIFPKFALLSATTGPRKLVWFRTLKISHRNWIPRLSAKRNERDSARSLVSRDGFTMENGFNELYVPVAGDANAARFR